MNIETKYSLGDKVWKINQNKPKVWKQCTFCEGHEKEVSFYAEDTKVLGLDGTKRRCPKCMGYGGQNKYLELEWRVTGELTVGMVEYRFSANETREDYMCAETGVGGGTIHYVDTLYPSEKEAQAECDRRNKE